MAAEDGELKKVEQPGDRTLLDHLLTPFNRAGSKRFLKEARGKVWRNAQALSLARAAQSGPSWASGSESSRGCRRSGSRTSGGRARSSCD